MQNHVKILGVLHIVMGALGALGALAMLLLFGGIASIVGMSAADGSADAAVAIPVLGAVGGFVFFAILLVSLPGIIVGWGLINYKSWARICGMIVAALQLFGVPVGTALGIYGLWVLLNTETEALFRNPPQAR